MNPHRMTLCHSVIWMLTVRSGKVTAWQSYAIQSPFTVISLSCIVQKIGGRLYRVVKARRIDCTDNNWFQHLKDFLNPHLSWLWDPCWLTSWGSHHWQSLSQWSGSLQPGSLHQIHWGRCSPPSHCLHCVCTQSAHPKHSGNKSKWTQITSFLIKIRDINTQVLFKIRPYLISESVSIT